MPLFGRSSRFVGRRRAASQQNIGQITYSLESTMFCLFYLEKVTTIWHYVKRNFEIKES